MKKWCIIGLTAATSILASAAFADPILGLWRTQEDDGAYGHIEMRACDDNFCGVLVESFRDGKSIESDTIGRMIVTEMVPQGAGKYEGKIWRPSNDKTYYSKIQLDGETMDLAGCLLGGFLCASQIWTRVK